MIILFSSSENSSIKHSNLRFHQKDKTTNGRKGGEKKRTTILKIAAHQTPNKNSKATPNGYFTIAVKKILIVILLKEKKEIVIITIIIINYKFYLTPHSTTFKRRKTKVKTTNIKNKKTIALS